MRGQQPWRTNRARVLRAHQTSAEGRLWQKLRARRLGGHKFVRQVPVGPYFADFLCRQARLIIELDGATHASEAERAADTRREMALAELGYAIMRVSNTDVFDNLDGVCDTILAQLDGRL